MSVPTHKKLWKYASQFIPRCPSTIYMLFSSLGHEAEIILVLVPFLVIIIIRHINQKGLQKLAAQVVSKQGFQSFRFFSGTDRQTDRRIEAPCQSLKINSPSIICFIYAILFFVYFYQNWQNPQIMVKISYFQFHNLFKVLYLWASCTD